MVIRTFILLLVILSFYSSLSVAIINSGESYQPHIDIRKEILTLIKTSSDKPNNLLIKLQKKGSDFSNYNYAEQFLILIAEARVKQQNNEHKAVVTLIEKAKLLSPLIPNTQLYLPMFSDAYLLLARSYAALNDYENAFQNKMIFVDNLNNYQDNKNELTVEKLTEKYSVVHKIEENKLLANENKLKELRIDSVNKEQNEQQRKFIIIFFTIILFILLFLRQLKIRNKLIVLAKTDSLTGLLNRAELFYQGQKMIQVSKEQQLDLSVLLFDIDNFKKINDEHGHLTGDLILTKIAQLVNETMRARDVFSRLGGEEFVCILPRTNINQAKAIAVRVMEKVAGFNFEELGANEKITLSIGVASLKDTNIEFNDILHAADLAMHQAKAKGKNLMVTYEGIAKNEERRQR